MHLPHSAQPRTRVPRSTASTLFYFVFSCDTTRHGHTCSCFRVSSRTVDKNYTKNKTFPFHRSIELKTRRASQLRLKTLACVEEKCFSRLIGILTASVKSVLTQYHKRIVALEGEKYDLEYEVAKKDFEISDLNSQVNDLRGKFMKPTLKKVSKYENKFAKLQKKAAEFNFRNQLKQVKKKEFTLEEEDKEPKKSEKAEWQTKK
ncbi:troponin I isoform X2 [Ceratina calcarata]|uniref:Troponin I isoform X2 n=1 Tax=Ceratina calcarata TaxID=156304 RepID=A0AAJ7WAD6_9HYME|nr:troponin I isoform X2 [Ceratina calcarata]